MIAKYFLILYKTMLMEFFMRIIYSNESNKFYIQIYRAFRLLSHFNENRYAINVNFVNQAPIYVGHDVVVEMPYF